MPLVRAGQPRKQKISEVAKARRTAVAHRVLDNIVKGKKPGVGQAMVDVGYSPKTAQHATHYVTSTKEWQDALEDYFPRDMLANAHRELIGAAQIQHYEFPKSPDAKKKELTNDQIREIVESVDGCRLIYVKDAKYYKVAYFQVPDGRIRKDAIELAYKLKKQLTPDAVIVDNRKTRIAKLSNKELAELQKKLAADLMLNRKK